MMRPCILGVLLLAAVAHGAGIRGAEKVTPVEKVIDLLKKLSAQTADQGKKEAKQYDDFSCFCKEQADEKLYQIEKSTAKLEKLAAQISELEGEIQQLNSDISDLSTQISDLEKEIESISDTRAKEHSAYLVEAKDMSDAISAIERAIAALKDSKEGQKGDTKLNLLEVQAMAVQVLALSTSSSLVAPSDAELRTLNMLAGPGQPHAYEFHSNDIIATLEGLQKTFKKNKAELDEAEFKVRAAFEKKKLGLSNEKKFAEKERSEKSALEASKSDELAAAQEDEANETRDKKMDGEFMKVLTDQCETKAEEFDQRSSTRTNELTAISEALDALEKGVQPNYGANAKLTGLAQRSATSAGHWAWVQNGAAAPVKPASFIQLRGSSSTTAKQVTQRVLELIQGAASRLSSPELSAVALKVKLTADHFVKVRGLIKDLISKLKADAEAEAEQKGFCDREMSAAINARDEAKMTIEEKTADISKNEAEKAQLIEDINGLQKAIAENMKALNEATELRDAERADNEKTLADADGGKEAVTFALTTLKEFYEGAFLVQTGYTPPNAGRDGKTVGDMAPESFSGTYHGNQGASKGIIGLLEVILSDFERTLETVAETEEEAQTKFEAFEDETEKDNASKKAEVETKEARVSDIEDALVTLTDEKSDADKKLDGALAELEKLKPMCVEGSETYAERVAKREEEIAALKEAMQILIDWQGF